MDDGSTLPVPTETLGKPRGMITRLDVLRLRRNLGHQRAISIGLAFAQAERALDAVLIMDGDGEDQPADVPALLRRLREENGTKIVFAARLRRSEGVIFTVFYTLYRLTHRVLTGRAVRVGNFSVVPSALLSSLVVVSELWNHYAAAVFKAGLPYAMVPTRRGQRLGGASRMNFSALVVHGLSAISVFGDVVGVRLLIGSMLLMLLSTIGILAVLGIRVATDLAIPGWATYTVATLLVLLLQATVASFLLAFIILSARANVTFLPLRDYHFFVREVVSVVAERQPEGSTTGPGVDVDRRGAARLNAGGRGHATQQ